MNTIETIRTEIERRIKLHDALADRAESEMLVNLEIGAAQALDDLLSYLDTLQEPEIDFEQELYNRFGMVKDFTLGMRIAQCFYNLGLKNAK